MARADGAASFAVLNPPDQPIQWGGVIAVGVKGSVPGANPADANSWKVTLNGVQLGVARVFIGAAEGEPPAGGGANVYRLVLTRPDFYAQPANPAVSTVAPAVKNPGDVIAGTIRAVAPTLWSANPVAVQVTLGGSALAAEAGRNVVSFRLCSPVRLAASVALLVLLAVALVYAWLRTGAFRDDAPALPYQERLFSLGRLQLAFWTTLVVGGYLYLYLTTGQFEGLLNSTASILLGISAATTLTSAVVTPPQASAAGTPVQKHVNWLIDILSDTQGVNLHRLQMAIWTLAFGLVFVSQLATQFAFPVFDNTAYALMGISSGTYVWLKRTEN